MTSNQEEAGSILQAMEQEAHTSVLVGGLMEAYIDEGLGAVCRPGCLRKVCRPGGHARTHAVVAKL